LSDLEYRVGLEEVMSMSPQAKAWLLLGAALAVGAVAQKVAGQEAAMLGLTALELALLWTCVGAVASRRLG
jgi:hypothetical protein